MRRKWQESHTYLCNCYTCSIIEIEFQVVAKFNNTLQVLIQITFGSTIIISDYSIISMTIMSLFKF